MIFRIMMSKIEALISLENPIHKFKNSRFTKLYFNDSTNNIENIFM